jgi:hypothetical protein
MMTLVGKFFWWNIPYGVPDWNICASFSPSSGFPFSNPLPTFFWPCVHCVCLGRSGGVRKAHYPADAHTNERDEPGVVSSIINGKIAFAS